MFINIVFLKYNYKYFFGSVNKFADIFGLFKTVQSPTYVKQFDAKLIGILSLKFTKISLNSFSEWIYLNQI